MLILPVCVACKRAPATDICLGHLCNASRCLACAPHCFRTCHCGEGPYCPRCSCTCESLIVSTPVTSPVGRTSAVVRSPPREGWTPVHVMEDRWRRWSRHLLEEWWSVAKNAASTGVVVIHAGRLSKCLGKLVQARTCVWQPRGNAQDERSAHKLRGAISLNVSCVI